MIGPLSHSLSLSLSLSLQRVEKKGCPGQSAAKDFQGVEMAKNMYSELSVHGQDKSSGSVNETVIISLIFLQSL